MTKIALIIGFSYHEEDNINAGRRYLPGTIMDLYHAYKIVSDKGYDKISIVSDLSVSYRDMHEAMKQHQATHDIHVLRNIIPFTDKEQLTPLIQEVLRADFGFFYFSGHSLGTKLLLPGTQYISDTDMYCWMSSVPNDTPETLMIFDCCHGNNFMLPYVYDGITYRLTKGVNLYFQHKVISICASQSHQVSYSEAKGSPLTSSLYTHLCCNPPVSSIKHLHDKIVSDVAASTGASPKIYASYPDLHCIWPWILTDVVWNVCYDMYHGKITCVITSQ